MNSLKIQHEYKVKILQEKIKRLNKLNMPLQIYHGSSHIIRPFHFAKDQLIDISKLNKIIHINVEEMIIEDEPAVKMGPLVKAILKQGLMPPVVMDFPGISVGGVVGGCGFSSS